MADDPTQAISEFVRHQQSELVSISSPRECNESIATVRKDDQLYLVRFHSN